MVQVPGSGFKSAPGNQITTQAYAVLLPYCVRDGALRGHGVCKSPRGCVMIASVRAMLHVVCAVLVVGVACARAQTSEPTHRPPANAAQPDAAASPATPGTAAPSAVQRPRPQVNTAE